MTGRTERIDALAALLRDTARAHHDAFAEVDGADPDWALWYADHLHPKLAPFDFGITRAQLVTCLLKADTEHRARAPDRDWAAYYAALFLEHLAPASGQTDRLALYMTPFCPFCRMVLAAIDGLDVEIEMRDISRDAQHREDLIAARGRGTVPVLRITDPDGTDRWMPESRDIARYLQRTYG